MDNNNSPRKNTEGDDLFLDIARARHENAAHLREEATRQIPVVRQGAGKTAQKTVSCGLGQADRRLSRGNARQKRGGGSKTPRCSTGADRRRTRTAVCGSCIGFLADLGSGQDPDSGHSRGCIDDVIRHGTAHPRTPRRRDPSYSPHRAARRHRRKGCIGSIRSGRSCCKRRSGRRKKRRCGCKIGRSFGSICSARRRGTHGRKRRTSAGIGCPRR